MAWKFENTIPIYIQIVEQIKYRILLGEYSPGEKLKSVRELASEIGVNPNTIQRALTELENEKIINTKRTIGKFITQDELLLKEYKEKFVKMKIKDFLKEMKKLGISEKEISKIIKEKVK